MFLGSWEEIFLGSGRQKRKLNKYLEVLLPPQLGHQVVSKFQIEIYKLVKKYMKKLKNSFQPSRNMAKQNLNVNKTKILSPPLIPYWALGK